MKKIYLAFVATLSLSACDKTIEVEAPSFDVQVPKNTYEVGDTVTFNFTGYAENITFYSGVPGADYTYRNRIEVEGGVPQISLNTQYGGGGTQTNSLRLMVSSDLTAVTKEGIAAATWTDITSRATIAPNAVVTPSGTIDVSDLVQSGKPLYFALKFVGETDANRAAGNWIVPDFKASTLLPNGDAIPVATLQNAGWQTVSVTNDANAWYSRGVPIRDLVIIGGGKNAPPSEDWFVTKPLYFTKVSPDTGTPIQSVGSNAIEDFEYVYNKAGTYLVTFLASNASVDEQKTVVKQIELTIQE